MDIRAGDDPVLPTPLGLGRRGLVPNLNDLIVFILIAGAFVAIAHGAREMGAPLRGLDVAPITLDPRDLPEYALRTTLRMFAAILASLVFTFVVATLAAKSRQAEMVMIPVLDILQSVPILGFLSFTVTCFMALFPGSLLGVECAAIFAIFTCQAWNMTFSFYQSLRTVPRDLDEALPAFPAFAMAALLAARSAVRDPGLVWNMMMSMSGGWFFVVASEAITVGDTTIMLPGIGSYLALAIEPAGSRRVALGGRRDALVILPTTSSCSGRSSPGPTSFGSSRPPRSSARGLGLDLVQRAALICSEAAAPLGWVVRAHATARIRAARCAAAQRYRRRWVSRRTDRLARARDRLARPRALARSLASSHANSGWRMLVRALRARPAHVLRVIVLIALATSSGCRSASGSGCGRAWPSGSSRWRSSSPPSRRTCFFPLRSWHLRLRPQPGYLAHPLMVLGTQWYILFNVIAGASAFRTI